MLFNERDIVVFAGDSIMDCGRVKPAGEGSAISNPLGNGFVNIFFGYMHAIYPELHIRVINKGIGGNRSLDLLNRFDEDVIKCKPNVVFIMIGVNDAWRIFDAQDIYELHQTVQDYEDNLIEMINKCNAINAKVVLLSPFFLELNKKDSMMAEVAKRTDVMKKLSAKYDLPFVDIQGAFDELLTKTTYHEISRDRVHPFIVGQMLIVNEIMKKVIEL